MSVQREYPVAPLVGTAAAVFNDAGEVLLVQRGKPPNVGMWGLPGGLLDVGERLAAGAAREVREECGVVVEIRELVGVFEPIIRDGDGRVRYHYVVVDYWARYLSGEVRAAGLTWHVRNDLLSHDRAVLVEVAHDGAPWRLQHAPRNDDAGADG